MPNLIGKLRKWLDGEDDDHTVARTGDLVAKNPSEKFVVMLAREVEKVMMQEMFTPPGGTTYIPREYIVYLSKEDDLAWRGDKRRGLQEGLHHALSECALSILGNKKAQTGSFAVELRTDDVLNAGEFRVQPVWDNETSKTIVKARAAKPTRESSENASELTTVRPRKPLYSVDVWKGGHLVRSVDFSTPSISIGRGSSQISVDLELEDDPEISRKQATLVYDSGRFVITAEGTNPIALAGREIEKGESVEMSAGSRLQVGVYVLVFKSVELVS